MKLNMYVVKDSKSEVFSNPIYDHTDETAIRAFIKSCSAADGPMADYPEDFILYRVGNYDTETGGGYYEPTPYSLMNGIEALKKSREKIEKLEHLHAEIDKLNSEEH